MNKKTFLEEIKPGINTGKDFYLKLYGYAMYDNEFEKEALDKLEKNGYSMAREIYQKTIDEYNSNWDKQIKKMWIEERKGRKKRAYDKIKRNSKRYSYSNLRSKLQSQIL